MLFIKRKIKNGQMTLSDFSESCNMVLNKSYTILEQFSDPTGAPPRFLVLRGLCAVLKLSLLI